MANNVKYASSDTKAVEKSQLTLPELPEDVLENVVGQLSFADCLSLRKVSRDLRSFVDSSRRHCQTVKFNFIDSRTALVCLDELRLTYNETIERVIVTSSRKDTREVKTYQDHRCFEGAVFEDAFAFLENPKLEIGQLDINIGECIIGFKFLQFLKSQNLRLNVKSVLSHDLELLNSVQQVLKAEKLEEILCETFNFGKQFTEVEESDWDILKNPKLKFKEMIFTHHSDGSLVNLLVILKLLNSQLNICSIRVAYGKWILPVLRTWSPEKVEEIIIDGLASTKPFNDDFNEITVAQFNEIARSEQWKRKTRLNWCPIPEEIGLEELVDFKAIGSYNFELTEENLIKIRDILLKSPHLETLELKSFVFDESMENKTKERIKRIMHEDPTYDASTRRFSIPNSQDYFQLKFHETRHETVSK